MLFQIITHYFRVLSFCNFVYYPNKLANLEERINTWHKTKLYAFPKRVFKISAKKIQKHERTVINTYGIKLEFLGLGGIYKLCWHFLPFKCWQKVDIFGLPKGRDIHIECSKQFKWNSYFYVSGQSQLCWAALELLLKFK